MTTNEERIEKEEAYWDGPKLFVLGLVFLAASVGLIYVLSSI